jgi:hypothetical protein
MTGREVLSKLKTVFSSDLLQDIHVDEERAYTRLSAQVIVNKRKREYHCTHYILLDGEIIFSFTTIIKDREAAMRAREKWLRMYKDVGLVIDSFFIPKK